MLSVTGMELSIQRKDLSVLHIFIPGATEGQIWKWPPPNSPQSFSLSRSRDPPGIHFPPSGGLSKVGRHGGNKINCKNISSNYFLRLCGHSPPGTPRPLEIWSNYPSLESGLGALENFFRMNFLFCNLKREQINIVTFLPILKCYTELTGSLRVPDHSNYFSIAAERRAETSFQLATSTAK